jgi:hypothetical protein
MVKCLFVVNRSCIHKEFKVSPTGKNSEDSNLASVEAMQWALLYLSIGYDIENISHSAAEMCRSTFMHVQYSFSYNSQMKCFRTHVGVDIFLVLVSGTYAQSLSVP